MTRGIPLAATLLSLVLPAALMAQSDSEALAHARRLLEQHPLIDGHNDLPWEIRTQREHPMDVEAYDLRKTTPGHTDLARLREGRVGAQFWSIYVPGEIRDSGFARVQLEQFDIARRTIARYPELLVPAYSADDIERAFREKKIGSLLGMEGGHVIENSLGALRMYYEMGARYLTLTHNVTLDWADAAADSAKHGGLTDFGREVVREMNRLGMLVDLSHDGFRLFFAGFRAHVGSNEDLTGKAPALIFQGRRARIYIVPDRLLVFIVDGIAGHFDFTGGKCNFLVVPAGMC